MIEFSCHKSTQGKTSLNYSYTESHQMKKKKKWREEGKRYCTLEKAFSPMNQNSKLSTVTICKYFSCGFSTFALGIVFFTFLTGITTLYGTSTNFPFEEGIFSNSSLQNATLDRKSVV